MSLQHDDFSVYRPFRRVESVKIDPRAEHLTLVSPPIECNRVHPRLEHGRIHQDAHQTAVSIEYPQAHSAGLRGSKSKDPSGTERVGNDRGREGRLGDVDLLHSNHGWVP